MDVPAVVASSKQTRQWAVDSGSCFDIVGRSALSSDDECRRVKSDKFVILQTANGAVRESRRSRPPVGMIGKDVDAVALGVCPSAISLG